MPAETLTKHQITVRNDKLQLSAAYLNGIAIGLFVVGGISPLFAVVRETIEAVTPVAVFSVLCLAASFGLHTVARTLLGRQEDPDE